MPQVPQLTADGGAATLNLPRPTPDTFGASGFQHLAQAGEHLDTIQQQARVHAETLQRSYDEKVRLAASNMYVSRTLIAQDALLSQTETELLKEHALEPYKISAAYQKAFDENLNEVTKGLADPILRSTVTDSLQDDFRKKSEKVRLLEAMLVQQQGQVALTNELGYHRSQFLDATSPMDRAEIAVNVAQTLARQVNVLSTKEDTSKLLASTIHGFYVDAASDYVEKHPNEFLVGGLPADMTDVKNQLSGQDLNTLKERAATAQDRKREAEERKLKADEKSFDRDSQFAIANYHFALDTGKLRKEDLEDGKSAGYFIGRGSELTSLIEGLHKQESGGGIGDPDLARNMESSMWRSLNGLQAGHLYTPTEIWSNTRLNLEESRKLSTLFTTLSDFAKSNHWSKLPGVDIYRKQIDHGYPLEAGTFGQVSSKRREEIDKLFTGMMNQAVAAGVKGPALEEVARKAVDQIDRAFPKVMSVKDLPQPEHKLLKQITERLTSADPQKKVAPNTVRETVRRAFLSGELDRTDPVVRRDVDRLMGIVDLFQEKTEKAKP